MDPGFVLIIVGVLLMAFGALLAFQTLPGVTAETKGIELEVTVQPSPQIPGTPLNVRTAFLVSFLLLGTTLTAAGIYIVVDTHESLHSTAQAALAKNEAPLATAVAQPTSTSSPRPTPPPAGVPTPPPGPTRENPEALFKQAFDQDKLGNNASAIELYERSLTAGLTGNAKDLAHLEIGLLLALAISSSSSRGDRTALLQKCSSAKEHLNSVVGSLTASADQKSSANRTLDQLGKVCPFIVSP